MSDSALVQTVAAYVPPCLVRQIVAGIVPTPGEITSTEAAVLFADISGFTPMAEALARAGRQGAEEMTRHLNDTFSANIALITAYGGDVAAFGGDAILAFFVPQFAETAETVAWRTLTCAVEMRKAMEPFAHIETLVGPFSLKMKFGLSFGRIIAVSVGSPQRGLEFVIAGRPVDQAAKNENHAESGQVVADASLLDLVGDRAVVEPVAPGASSRGFVMSPQPNGSARGVDQVLTVKPAPALAHPPIDYDGLDDGQRQAILDAVAVYLPAKLYEDLASKGRLAGDHRPVTSLFVNFTGLDYDHDPDVGARLQTYITRTQEIIHRYDGNLNRVLTGDKGSQLHILFGAPVAHEDDKVRALRCALALQRELSALPFIRAQRIGLASGYVFAGPVGAMERGQYDAAGGWLPVTRGEYTVMGDIVNLSARLTGICPPGQVVVDAHTRSRTAQRFEFRPFGPVKLKGKARPVTPYLVDGERPAENALVTRYLLSQRPLVGRRNEMAVIQGAVTDALRRQERVLVITGPAGVGKSRLIEEAVRRWLQADGVGYGGDCMSHGVEIPYLPWADLWRAQFDLHEADAPQERQEKILRLGRDLGLDLGEWAALVVGLLGLPPRPSGEEHPALAPLDPQARHLRLLDLTADLIAAQARQTPLLLLFEDLHWADRASLELIDHVAERIADLPVLICMAYRPHDRISLACLERPFCQTLRLGELSDEEGTALVRSMLGDMDLPPAFLRLVNAKAQGNPLFVEELVNGLVDAGLLRRENGAYRVVGALDQVEVPDTVEAVLLARMDRLAAPLRDLLGVASVIGRQFAYAVLRGIYPYTMSEAEMLDRLTGLERLDLTRLERPDPELEYLFKHALTQEVAYENLSFALRRDLHERIGSFLEQHYSDHLETLFGTLAHHFARGGQAAQALPYALSAGAQAQALFANDEALAHYRQAEDLLAQLPAHEYEKEAIQLYLGRGELHILLGNFDEAEADLERGLTLAQGARQDYRAQAQALNGLAYLRYWQAHNEEMLDLARRALTLAEAEDRRHEMMTALHYIAMALVELGNHDEAIEFFLQARTLAEAMGDRHALSTIHMGIAVAAFNQGQLRDALEAMEELLVIYRESGDKHRVSNCLSNIANTLYYLGEFEAAHATHQESITIDREIGKRVGLAYSLRDLGELYCHRGDYAAGLAAMEEAAAIFEEIGDDAGRAWCDLALGREYYLDIGPDSQAEALLRRALPVLQAGESHEEVADALLALGRLCLEGREHDQAQISLDQALELCQKYDLRWRLPEATARLAELALARGDAGGAADLAQQTLDAIANGGCPDLRSAAHMVLAQVADDSLHHYELAVSDARQRSRHIDLARTLAEVGHYLGDRAEVELRAQGHTYQHEAQALAEEMGLPLGRVRKAA
jgi:class 3 adenylate cyclase/tetratricopeptide (TPR) repeat protein